MFLLIDHHYQLRAPGLAFFPLHPDESKYCMFWNKTRAAQELNISRRNLIRKVSKYNLEP